MPFDPDFLLALPVLLFSIVAHECAHGLAALALGDPTARERGRLTLNPLPHLDPVGSIVVPVALVLLRSPVWLAWARPVPVDPARLRQPRDHVVAVALAGPASNALLALAFAALAKLAAALGAPEPLRVMAVAGVQINCALGLFNLVPIPPLDGSWVLMRFLPLRHILMVHRFRLAGLAAVALLVAVPPVARVVFETPLATAVSLCFAAFGLPADGGLS